MVTSAEFNSFIRKFVDLWKSGMNASFNLETHAGEASVSFRLGSFSEDEVKDQPATLIKEC